MRIGIIGAGNMGATLTARLTRLGHQVAIANSRGPQTLAGVAAQTGATPVPITQVTSKADVVIVTIPEKSIPALPAGLLSALPEDTVTIDTGNYVPKLRDGHINAIDAGLPESQWVQSQLRRSRTGVRFVLTNPSDPSRLNEFSDWYDTYSAALTVPGYLANDFHFENPDASGERNSPRYATIYDIISPDPATAWPDTEHSPAYPTHLFSDPRARLVSPALRASYALVGSQLQPSEHGPLTGIHVILSNGGGDTERQHQEAEILQTGFFYSAARFRIIEGSPEPAEWLEVFETDDPDPLHAFPRVTSHTLPASQIQPQLSESFRLASARKTGGTSSWRLASTAP